MRAALAEQRRPKGSVALEVHEIALSEYERTGSVPPAHVLAELTGIDRVSITRALKQLCDEGQLGQPHGDRAPYIPLRRPDGTRVKPVLMVVDEGQTETLEEVTAGHTPEEVKRALELRDEARQWMELTEGHTPEEVKRALELIGAARQMARE
jgi:hypothetical protein